MHGVSLAVSSGPGTPILAREFVAWTRPSNSLVARDFQWSRALWPTVMERVRLLDGERVEELGEQAASRAYPTVIG